MTDTATASGSDASLKKKLNFSSSSTTASSTTTSKATALNADVRQIADWSIETTLKWLKSIGYEACVANFQEHRINGRALLMLNEDDLREIVKYNVGMRKNLFHLVRTLQLKHTKHVHKTESKKFFNDSSDEDDDQEEYGEEDGDDGHGSCVMSSEFTGTEPENTLSGDGQSADDQLSNPLLSLPKRHMRSKKHQQPINLDHNHNQEEASGNHYRQHHHHHHHHQSSSSRITAMDDKEPSLIAATPTKNICLSCLRKIDNSPYTNFESTPFGYVPLKSYKGEKRRTIVATAYLFFTILWSSFMLTVVHDRVPDMQKYPPLPDIILDNVPLIPWAFFAAEAIGIVLLLTMLSILVLHRYRLIIFRRMCSLGGTIFILRSITMLITSLSVPGIHIQCSSQRYGSLSNKLYGAWNILSGVGLYVSGLQTCGDYMFSGHTVWLTLLAHFITEYTPGSGSMRLVHTLVWVANAFGVFFILGAHEHYSIDVFVAFYISSRMFLYYHSLANNSVLFSTDHRRIRIWFPMFSYLESNLHSRVPNEYQNPLKSLKFKGLRRWFWPSSGSPKSATSNGSTRPPRSSSISKKSS